MGRASMRGARENVVKGVHHSSTLACFNQLLRLARSCRATNSLSLAVKMYFKKRVRERYYVEKTSVVLFKDQEF